MNRFLGETLGSLCFLPVDVTKMFGHRYPGHFCQCQLSLTHFNSLFCGSLYFGLHKFVSPASFRVRDMSARFQLRLESPYLPRQEESFSQLARLFRLHSLKWFTARTALYLYRCVETSRRERNKHRQQTLGSYYLTPISFR